MTLPGREINSGSKEKFLSPLLEVETVGDTYLILRILRPLHYRFKAGQYATVLLSDSGGIFERFYSIASPPEEEKILEFCVQIGNDGRASQFFKSLSLGHEICFESAQGQFELKNPDLPLVLVAGGSGISPLRSILLSWLCGSNRSQPITLLYGCKTGNSIPFYRDLCQVQSEYSKIFQFFVSVDSDAKSEMFLGNTVEGLRQIYDLIDPRSHFYLCGPSLMVSSLVQYLREKKVEENRICFEKF